MDALPYPPSQLLPQLLAAKLIELVPLRPNPPPRSYDPNARCEFHMGGIGHWTNRCFNLRHRIQDLIDAGLLRFEKDESKVNQNASPVKGNVEGSPLTDVATKGREGLDSSLLTSSPVASDPFPEAGVTQGYDDNRAEPSVVDSYGVQVREILTAYPSRKSPTSETALNVRK